MIGRRLAHFTIREPLGRGGMGEVYLAEDSKLDRLVALKVLPAELADDPERLRRLIRDYGRSQTSLFPSGAYFKGGTYGDDVNLPLEFDETNNSNYDDALCVFETP